MVVDSHGLKAKLFKEIFDIHVPVEACRRHRMLWMGDEALRQYEHVQTLVYETGAYHQRLEPMPGAVRRIKQLHARGNKLFSVTSRSTQATMLAEYWLTLHDLQKEITIVGVGRNVSKRQAAIDLKLDALADDDLPKLKECVGAVKNLYLFRQPHNNSVTDPGDGIQIVRGWNAMFRSLSDPSFKP